MYLRKFFDLPKSAPRLGLYSDCGKIPIKYLIKIRRLLFYWHILRLDKEELLFKFQLAQTLKPSKNDWVLTIKQDLKEININMNEDKFSKCL